MIAAQHQPAPGLRGVTQVGQGIGQNGVAGALGQGADLGRE